MNRKMILGMACLTLFVSSIAFGQHTKPQLDERAKKHLTQEQIDEMSELKILQANFLYQKSFYIDETRTTFYDRSREIPELKDCPTVDINKVDIWNYSLVRKHNRRLAVPFAEELFINEEIGGKIRSMEGKRPAKIHPMDGNCYCIILLSQEEIEEAYKQIEKDYTNRKTVK